MSEKKLTKFAFWEYDLPPYVLGTETDGKRDRDGTVSVPSYGLNARLKPLKLMDVEEGRRILTEIRQADAMRRHACNAAHRLFKQDVIRIAPFMKKILKAD